MKTEKAVIITVLAFAALVLSYWLGYENGRSSKPKFVSTTAPNVPPTDGKGARKPVNPTPKPPLEFAPRDPLAKPNLIDLSAWYNATLKDGRANQGPNGNFASLPTGVQTLAGTEFDIRGLIQLRSSTRYIAPYPPRIEGIRVGLRCSKLHFLQNTLFGMQAPSGLKIGAYVVHYADGDTLAVPLRIGENILDWWIGAKSLPGGTTVLAWDETNPYNPQLKGRVHLNKFTWENPRPDVEVTSLDFICDGKAPAPFVVAITAEP